MNKPFNPFGPENTARAGEIVRSWGSENVRRPPFSSFTVREKLPAFIIWFALWLALLWWLP